MTPAAGLRAIGWPVQPGPEWLELQARHPLARLARVAEQHRSGYRLADGPDAELFSAESPPEWQRNLNDPLQRAGVGDWVLVEGGQIVALLPRRSALKRGAAGEHYRQQLIAANIDTAFVVTGLDADFNPRRIERYLMLVHGGGIEPVVVLTKSDKGADIDAALAALQPIRDEGVAVHAVNAKDADSVALLSPWLQPGHTVVLVGSSGAGKSTLTNTLLGNERMKTGDVRASDSRGRHTTTHRALLPLLSGACLIDTPGMRELKPTGEEKPDRSAFADIDALAEQCRFRDCRHEREPGCAVRAAIEAGTLDPLRVANWRKLADEVAVAAETLETRQAQNADERKPGEKRGTRASNKWQDRKRDGH
ncbi:ribosome small subunit-dependent GTPase A [Solilutibacter silvestris]|uniref:Small ribosomal subunit biogenesis GTPase RsgA n=1 Tax=Solilutibacter silvestris TaxID=1645665 RepID=A0A2K1Q1N9_9GAMM|nr:ribosome small subunit-dependent GTPase A [Lysobacter silvestris]PNS08959.1 ribosome small subunit-dependent GTPase A [Lysobacter silvestris]